MTNKVTKRHGSVNLQKVSGGVSNHQGLDFAKGAAIGGADAALDSVKKGRLSHLVDDTVNGAITGGVIGVVGDNPINRRVIGGIMKQSRNSNR